MRVYVDSSALVKRGIQEPASEAMEQALDSFGAGACFSSVLAWIEVSRALRARLEAADPRLVVNVIETALSAVHRVSFTEQMVGYARRIGAPQLRGLDAIHLASAVVIEADLFVGYDKRLLVVAEEMGFRTLSPGVD